MIMYVMMVQHLRAESLEAGSLNLNPNSAT